MPDIPMLIQLFLYLLLLTLLSPPLGAYLADVFSGRPRFTIPGFGRLERLVMRLAGIDATEEMDWKRYTMALLLCNAFGFLLLDLMQLFQASLPLNAEGLPDVRWDLAVNTAVSFVTNTNWQSYAGETTLSTFVQMAGLTVQNFVSAATGIAVMVALIRGISRRESSGIGNFWADLVRSVVHILLPLAILYTLLLVGDGCVQTFGTSVTAMTLEGSGQTIPLGPVASQEAIKQLGTNGGGFFNANSAHPFENPTPWTNAIELLAILLLPSALVLAYGRMIGSTRQGWTIWMTMMVLFLVMLGISMLAEHDTNPALQTAHAMEGKEVRFGVGNSVLWSVATTAASNGSVNAMQDSFSPLAGGIAMLNMMFGEVIFGGVGAGLYGMLVFVLLTVFIAGLMVGRTPEFLGKKIEAFEVQMASIAVLAPGSVILLFTALASLLPEGIGSLTNGGPHGFSQMLYAFTSAAANNGSAFAGLNANTPFYNLVLSAGMLIGRFGVIIPILAIAGSLVRKHAVPVSTGTFRTDTPTFSLLLMGVICIVGALTFFPALALGPVVEHFLMLKGQVF